MSYSQVVKRGSSNTNNVLTNCIVGQRNNVSGVNHKNTRVYKPKLNKNVVHTVHGERLKYKPKLVNSIDKQCHPVEGHSTSIDSDYCMEHEDGVVTSKFFTTNKFNHLESVNQEYCCPTDDTRQNNDGLDSIHVPCTQVGVEVHSISCNDIPTGVVSPSNKSRHVFVPETTANSNKPMNGISGNRDSKYVLGLTLRPHNRSRINNARDNDTFKLWDSQNSQKFGFIPLSNLKLPSEDKRAPLHGTLTKARYLVKQKGDYNFLGAQIQIPSQLNPDSWQKYLADYWDQQLPYLIRYGFPLDFDQNIQLKHIDTNHPSANQHLSDVKAYLDEESKFNAILGPFDNSPYPDLHLSPFMTREKPGATNRRVIIDLSYPPNHSVNAGVSKDHYLGTDFVLTLPSIDTITNQIRKLGKGSLIYKVDISRAFRHVKIDPSDYYLLGLKLKHYYLDTCLPFGFRHGSSIFQRLSDAIRFIMTCKGHSITNYIDNLIGLGAPSEANAAFETLITLLGELGLQISDKKLVTPATRAVCLGVEVDTVNFTLSVPAEKLADIKHTCQMWRHKTACSKRDLQSLLGRLLYITKCVRTSRAFLNRMLALLRASDKVDLINLDFAFKQDLNWFCQFLPSFNGTAFFSHRKFTGEVHLDACLNGLGAICGKEVYSIAIPLGFLNFDIVHLEMLNILVAVRVWARYWAKHKILIHCDNQAVVAIMESARTRDLTLAAICRNIYMECAKFDIELHTTNIPGKKNVIADALSRLSIDSNYLQVVQAQVPDCIWVEAQVHLTQINWSI